MSDVSGRVAETLRDQQRVPSLARPRLSLPRRRRTLLLVVVGVVLLALAAVAAKVVIDLGALTIDTIPGRPTALPSAVASGPTLGHPATLPDAEREAGFTARVPDALGSPDAVWVDETPDGARIVLGWKPTRDAPGDRRPPLGRRPLRVPRGRGIGVQAPVHRMRTRSSRSRSTDTTRWWIAGPHELDLVTGEGTYARYRVAGNVLVWKERRCRHAPRDDPGPGRSDPDRRERPRLTARIERGGNLVRYGGVEGSNTSVSTRGAPR